MFYLFVTVALMFDSTQPAQQTRPTRVARNKKKC